MVGNHTHSDILLSVLAIFCSGLSGNDLDDRLEDIGIIVGSLALQRHTQTFESHTGIDHLGRQRFQRTVSLTVELHEHQVPDFDHLRMIFIDHFGTALGSTFFVRTEVYMDFRAGTARTGITHFPKIIMFVTVDDMIFRQELLPISGSFIVTRQTFGGASFKYSCIQTFRVQLQNIYQIFPCPSDRFLLEIITERPVSQHFKHGVMIGIVSYLFQVVMLSAYTKTFLRVRDARILNRYISQDYIFKLVHARIGEHQCRVTLHYHWSRRYNLVLLGSEELFKRFTDFFCCQHNLFI